MHRVIPADACQQIAAMVKGDHLRGVFKPLHLGSYTTGVYLPDIDMTVAASPRQTISLGMPVQVIDGPGRHYSDRLAILDVMDQNLPGVDAGDRQSTSF